VHACGINPADWALCLGLFSGALPRGIGLEVSGTVDEVGPDVDGVVVGDVVLGPVPFAPPTAGAADLAVLDRWTPVPPGLDLDLAASLPMAADTAWGHLDALGPEPGELLLVHGAGSMMGFVAVQLARHRGVRVIATAGPARAAELEELGVATTSYGEGMVERVRALAGGSVDRALDASPADDPLADLVRLTGDPDRVATMTHHASAAELGVRAPTPSELPLVDVLAEVTRLAAEGAVTVPISGRFALEDFRSAMEISRARRAGGKLLLRCAPRS
jgi:NADPH:quinone reductase-like Zn-dependent oxidoreductase